MNILWIYVSPYTVQRFQNVLGHSLTSKSVLQHKEGRSYEWQGKTGNTCVGKRQRLKTNRISFFYRFRFVLAAQQRIMKETDRWLFVAPLDDGCSASLATRRADLWLRRSSGWFSRSRRRCGLANTSVGHSVLFVHHLDNGGLVWGVHGCHGNISNGSKFAAVVEVLVFQPEKVPHEAAEDFERS